MAKQIFLLLVLGLSAFAQEQSPIVFKDGNDKPEYADPDLYGYRYCAYWKLADGTAIHSTCDPYKFMRCGKYLDYEYQCCPGFETVTEDVFPGNNGGKIPKCAGVLPQWNFCPNILMYLPGHFLFGSQIDFGNFVKYQPMETFTIFAPNSVNQKLIKDTFGGTFNTKLNNSLLYHVTKGRIYADDLKNGMVLTSIYKDLKLKVSTYSYGIICVECVELTMADVECQNGLIHFVRKPLIPPTGLAAYKRKSLFEALSTDSRSSDFAASLSQDLKDKLSSVAEDSKWYTVFAPDSKSWKDLSKNNTKEDMEIIASNHVLEGLYCSAGLIRNTGRMKTLAGDYVSVDCTTVGIDEARWITDSCGNTRQVLESDIMAPNGVAHLINGTLVPMSARTTKSVLNECYDRLGFRQWSNFMADCDLYIEKGQKYAYLFPVDYAFKWWSNYTQFKPEYDRFMKDKKYQCRVARYHIMKFNDQLQSVKDLHLTHDKQAFDANNKERLFETNYFVKDRYHGDLYFHYSPVIGYEAMKTKDGAIYRTSRVNAIPEKLIKDILREHPQTTIVNNQTLKADMDGIQFKPNDPLNLFLAAVDEGWKDASGKPLKEIETYGDGENLKNYLLLHHIPLYLWGGDIGYFQNGTVHTFKSSVGQELIFKMGKDGVMKIGYEGLDESKWSTVIKFNLHAKDGIVWLIKPFLPCPESICPTQKIEKDYYDVYVSACMIMELGGANRKAEYTKKPLLVTSKYPEMCAKFQQPTYVFSKVVKDKLF